MYDRHVVTCWPRVRAKPCDGLSPPKGDDGWGSPSINQRGRLAYAGTVGSNRLSSGYVYDTRSPQTTVTASNGRDISPSLSLSLSKPAHTCTRFFFARLNALLPSLLLFLSLRSFRFPSACSFPQGGLARREGEERHGRGGGKRADRDDALPCLHTGPSTSLVLCRVGFNARARDIALCGIHEVVLVVRYFVCLASILTPNIFPYSKQRFFFNHLYSRKEHTSAAPRRGANYSNKHFAQDVWPLFSAVTPPKPRLHLY